MELKKNNEECIAGVTISGPTNNGYTINWPSVRGYIVIRSLICTFMIELGLAIWGGIELFENAPNCDALYNSNLWKFGLVVFILQILTVIVLMYYIIVYMHISIITFDKIKKMSPKIQ